MEPNDGPAKPDRADQADQRVVLSFDAQGKDPDAIALVGRLQALLKVLVSVDSRSWNLKSPRHHWRVADAERTNPLNVVITGTRTNKDDIPYDVAGEFGRRLAHLRSKPDADLAQFFTLVDLQNLKKAAQSTKNAPMSLTYSSGVNGSSQTVSLSDQLRKNADALLRSSKVNRDSEYMVVDGLLRTVTADNREDMFEHGVHVVGFDGHDYDCSFDPSDSEAIGAHV